MLVDAPFRCEQSKHGKRKTTKVYTSITKQKVCDAEGDLLTTRFW